jgi:soluble lytic murein transglycosylase-like protein
MTRTKYRPEIELAAGPERLDPDLVEGLVLVESSGNAYAWNPEPHYRYFWNVKTWRPFRQIGAFETKTEYPPEDFPSLGGDPDQEWWGQQASWGLMQVMGAVARERGYRGVYLPELVDVETNLKYGCAHLGHLLEWADADVPKALAAFNAGQGGWTSKAGQAYAQKVLRSVAAVKAVPK